MKLVKFDAMLIAIQECHSVDEIKQNRDRAVAFEAYARVAMNTEAEQKTIEIRIRAERKASEMPAEMKKNPGKRNDKPTAAAAGGSLGIASPAHPSITGS